MMDHKGLKALAFQQPWAFAIMLGDKTVECRSRNIKTPIKDLVVCASKTASYCEPMPGMAYGYAIALVDVIDCVPFEEKHLEDAMMEDMPNPGDNAWILSNVRQIKPFPVHATASFFYVPDKIEIVSIETKEDYEKYYKDIGTQNLMNQLDTLSTVFYRQCSMRGRTTMKRSINLLLMDGTATGCWKGEFSNRTLVAYRMSRQQLVEGYEKRDEFGYSGVYILFGQTEEGDPQAYIGEAEDGMKRVRQHLSDGKDFWTEFILFVKSDNKLNKAHVRYLEDKLIRQAKSAGRYVLDNGTSSTSASLSENDEADMSELLDDIRLMTGVLGQKVFEPVLQDRKDDRLNRTYSLKVGKASAKGEVVSDGFVVFSGAQLGQEVTPSMGDGYRKLRDRLFEEGIVESFVLQKDYLFKSPSAAAAVVLGYNVSGPQKWIDSKGTSLRDNERNASED